MFAVLRKMNRASEVAPKTKVKRLCFKMNVSLSGLCSSWFDYEILSIFNFPYRMRDFCLFFFSRTKWSSHSLWHVRHERSNLIRLFGTMAFWAIHWNEWVIERERERNSTTSHFTFQAIEQEWNNYNSFFFLLKYLFSLIFY